MWIELLEAFNTGLTTLAPGSVVEVGNETGKTLIGSKAAKLAPSPRSSAARGMDETVKARSKRETGALSQPGEI